MLIFEEKSHDSDSTTFQRLSRTIGRFFASSLIARHVLDCDLQTSFSRATDIVLLMESADKSRDGDEKAAA
jgi:hypothetical protein